MKNLKQISNFEWEYLDPEMKVPAKIFGSRKIVEKITEDRTITQLKNMTSLPGVIEKVVALPDSHEGYGFPIGGVAAFDLKKGVISPGAVGYDINCSVRLLKTNLTKKQLLQKQEKITKALFKAIPVGVGAKGKRKLSEKELDQVLKNGIQWCYKKGFATKQDLENTEETGCLKKANPNLVSRRAKERGINQLGSLGAGNHFVEIQVVDKILDKKTAEKFNLKKGDVTIMIHCGSRGLGHQVASDYIELFNQRFNQENKDLIYASIKSKEGKQYLSAMNCAANFAFANKQMLTYNIREELNKVIPNFEAELIYDLSHNIAKIEKYKRKKVLVIRKGATRSFGKGRKELSKKYKKIGQPILIPGSMGTASYVLVGENTAEEKSFSSTAHGAGRFLSRSAAQKKLKSKNVINKLKKEGISIKFGSEKGIAEEAPEVYKDVNEVVNISEKVGIGRIVAKLKPLGVVKG